MMAATNKRISDICVRIFFYCWGERSGKDFICFSVEIQDIENYIEIKCKKELYNIFVINIDFSICL